ncbi:MAG: transcription-repair coupling factor [Cytophagales bacterium]|nr:transcription-repair coupling factor [Cytophagales bacterium]
MKTKDLIQLYKQDSIIGTIAERIKPCKPVHLQLKGLVGSLDAVIATAISELVQQNHLFVLRDKEEAAYFQNDLQNLINDKSIHSDNGNVKEAGNGELTVTPSTRGDLSGVYADTAGAPISKLPAVLLFPDSYKRPLQFDQADNANMQMRVEVLTKISQVEEAAKLPTVNCQLPAVLIVTYPEALAEKVVNKNTLKKNTFLAGVGDKVNTSFINKLLTELHFEKSDFVYEAGQFAIRGGIIDIYSYAHQLPYRIELSGDEIESIRTFDPDTQLSIEQVKQISLIPNTCLTPQLCPGRNRQAQTIDASSLQESFLNFLPDNTKIWIKDVQFTLDIIEKTSPPLTPSQLESEKRGIGETERGKTKRFTDSPIHPFTDSGGPRGAMGVRVRTDKGEKEEGIETAGNILKQLRSKVTIEFGKQFYFEPDAVSREVVEIFTFDAAPQPSFHKDFKLLTANLRDNQSGGLVNIIVAEASKQTERLATIFEELDPFVEFHSINIALREGFIDKRPHPQPLLDNGIEEIKETKGIRDESPVIIEGIEEKKEIEEIFTGIACYTDHQIFDRFYKHNIKAKHTKSKALTLKELKTLQPGDFVTHIDHGIGRFAGLDMIEVRDVHNEKPKMQEAIRIVYKNDDLLYVSIHSLHKISKYSGKEGTPQISKLGSQEWSNKKKKIKKKVKDIAKDLIELYAKRKAAHGFAFSEDNFMQAELESSFLYEDTPDQAKATVDTKKDMESPHPMDRLVCGDVGFGKTEVALRAAFKACCESKQVALLVPTTILAMQHYNTFIERLQKFPCNIEYINRFKSSKKIKEILDKVKNGEVDILIGTHRIISKDVKFKDLGLLIIDEEQKFGVTVKEKLKQLKVDVDTLTLTATPIPRTLHFSLMGARDLSIINTPPPNRKPITTRLFTFPKDIFRDNDNFLCDAIHFELHRGGQVFFVHNRIRDIEEVAGVLQRLVPDARIAVTHGKMEGNKLEKEMLKFINGEYDLLVSTSIIENGLDIPNANTIIINMAHMFGLSDLHQMRGRVGRSNKQAFCYLIVPPLSTLPSDARKRLSSLEEFSDLGDGFNVAMRDLDIRGAGNLLGAEQSGFIHELGFDMYHKILDEAVEELKLGEFKDLFKDNNSGTKDGIFVKDCIIETDLQMLIPEDYVSHVAERLNLYSELDSIKNLESLHKFKNSLIDRFGPIPGEVKELIETVKLRWKAKELGFEKLILKNETMKGYFMGYGKWKTSPLTGDRPKGWEDGKWKNTSSASFTGNFAATEDYYHSKTFGSIIQYVQSHPQHCMLKDINGKRIIIFEEVETVGQALDKLDTIIGTCVMA